MNQFAKAALLSGALCLWLPPARGAAPPRSHNMVANPGFEILAPDKTPRGWRYDRAVYAISTDRPHSGRYCLAYANDDPARYRLCTRAIKLQPGRMYEMSAWVRTENVRGKESGAGLCIEWHGADGRWLGGSYPAGVRGTHNHWTRVGGITGVVPEEATGFSISCYVRKGMTGKAWWDDIEVRPYLPPMVQTIVTNCYRNVTWGGPLTVDVGLALETYHVPLARWRAVLSVTAENRHEIKRVVARPVSFSQAHFEIDSSSWPPGKYRLACRVESSDQRFHGNTECTLRRVARRPAWKVWIDRHGRVMLDGRPFFPLGMYWSGLKQEELELYARSPFNCVMPYSNIDRDALDRAQKAGIKVIYSVKNYYAHQTWSPASLRNADDEYRVIAQKVRQLKDHPAIIAWYVNDELPLTMLPSLTAHRDWLEQLDPSRPTWVVLYQVDQVRRYLPTFDVIGTDPYPIPKRPLDMPLQWTRKTKTAVFSRRSVWMVPQVFNWAAYKKTAAEKAECRAPTLAEMRCMAWQCIAGGANGLVFYSWFDLWRMKQTDPFDKRWRDITTMAAEIKKWTPVLLSIDATPEFATSAVPRTVGWRLFQQDDATFLLAVNASRQPATATWTSGRAFRSGRRLLAPGAAGVRLDGKTVRLTLAPLEVMLVRLAE